jgi:serine/threonine protein kinase
MERPSAVLRVKGLYASSPSQTRMVTVLVGNRDLLAAFGRLCTPTGKKRCMVSILFSFFLRQHRPLLVDATRMADGKLVYIKQVQTNDQESRIALMLGSFKDPANHSVPILDTFVDDTDNSISYIVMPFLRLVDEPPFYAMDEILDFADQILEVSFIVSAEFPPVTTLFCLQGLVFMHSKGIAHR